MSNADQSEPTFSSLSNPELNFTGGKMADRKRREISTKSKNKIGQKRTNQNKIKITKTTAHALSSQPPAYTHMSRHAKRTMTTNYMKDQTGQIPRS
jgi:hypothetical protein